MGQQQPLSVIARVALGIGAPCCLLPSPLQPSKHPGLARLMPQLDLRSEPARPREKTWSSSSGTAQGAWGVVWWGGGSGGLLASVVEQEIP